MGLKKLVEQRNDKIKELREYIEIIKKEERALTNEEIEKREVCKDEISQLEKSIKIMESEKNEEISQLEKRSYNDVNNHYKTNKNAEEIKEIATEIRNFLGKNEIEIRSTMNTQINQSGGYATANKLANAIIKEAYERSEAMQFFDSTNIKGKLQFPREKSGVAAVWIEENPVNLADVQSPKLDLIILDQYRLYAEGEITQQLINMQDIDLVSYLKSSLSEKIANAMETSIFHGTGVGSPTGIIGNATKTVTGSLDVSLFKKAQYELTTRQRNNAKWFINRSDFMELDLLTDAMGRPLLQPDLTSKTGYIFLGRPVAITDFLESGNVVFATPSGYHTNYQKGIQFYVYDDSSYKKRGVVGYATDVYFDGCIKDDNSLVTIKLS